MNSIVSIIVLALPLVASFSAFSRLRVPTNVVRSSQISMSSAR
jgi:hypothetical protein